MKDYVLNEKPEPASNETVWAFDLGKGSIGKAVRRGNDFAQGIPAHPGGICRNQNRRRSPPDVAHAAGTLSLDLPAHPARCQEALISAIKKCAAPLSAGLFPTR